MTYPFKTSRQGVFDLGFTADPARPWRSSDHRLGQDHDAGPPAAPAPADRGPDPDRWPRHRRGDARIAAPRDGRRVPGGRPLQPLDPREPRRSAGPAPRGRDRAAARLAEAHEFILRSPAATTSSSASAAPRCRAASASASPSPAPSSRTPLILLLDEATSGLDTETEASSGGAGAATAPAPPSSSPTASDHRRADLIVVLDAGRIVEQGRFDELARDGPFTRLVSEGTFTVPNRGRQQPSSARSAGVGALCRQRASGRSIG